MHPDSSNYSVSQCTVANLLTWIDTNDIEIPEIQRPFVWNKTKVRDLIDSLYRGYPIGYLITWKSPKIKLKTGTMGGGAKILIDGRQRVTSLTASLLDREIVNKEYKKERIIIAFHPIKEKFEVLNPAISNDPSWIPNIASIVNGQASPFSTVKKYQQKNRNADLQKVESSIEKLTQIKLKHLGLIELGPDLNVDTVTVVFERVNSAGVPLSEADFVMSKIATYGDRGSRLRKLIDYFCYLATAPEYYPDLESDEDFAKSRYLKKIQWLTRFDNNLYSPSYSDLLRVAFTVGFNRERMGDLVGLLSGRNFEKKTFEEEIQEDTFKKLEKAVLRFTYEQDFKKFIMIVQSTGFIRPNMINSTNALNFAYAVYLKLRDMHVRPQDRDLFVRKWFVMSVLTDRYSDSAGTAFESDIKSIAEDYKGHLKHVEDTKLSPAFWNVELISNLETSNTSSPFLNAFFASQVKDHNNGFLSNEFEVEQLIQGIGDKHHVFPKAYVRKKFPDEKDYNQIANLVYIDQNVNRCIGSNPPDQYFGEVKKQCSGGPQTCSEITDMETLTSNMKENCIPDSIFGMTLEDYPAFLEERRKLMAEKIKDYYKNL